MVRNLRVVVTGATGNLGSRVVPALLAHPGVSSVTGIARRPPDRAEWPTGATYRSVDIGQPQSDEQLREILAGGDVVVHLAWRIQPSRDVADMRRVNVDGTKRVAQTAAETGVRALVHLSSLGAYAPGPKDRKVDETWPTSGIATSAYSRHKAETESWLDEFEVARPGLRLVRLRPALVLQERAASELTRYFLGPLAPVSIVRPALLPVVPRLPRMRFQIVHTDDVAAAVVAAVTGDVEGAFNLAAEPVLDARTIAATIHAIVVPVPLAPVRAAMTLGWKARLFPTDAGWLDMGLQTPLMDVCRAREVLGWTPRYDARDVLVEFMRGVADRRGGATPVLRRLVAPTPLATATPLAGVDVCRLVRSLFAGERRPRRAG